YFLENLPTETDRTVSLRVLDQAGWTNWLAALRSFDRGLHMDLAAALAAEFRTANPPADEAALQNLRRELSEKNVTLAFFAPRGVGLTAWSGDEKKRTQIRRRFMLLGQTLDGLRVWDIRRAVQ